ncbi:ciliary rootlet coiled-coil protein 2 isoform X3 [Scophthalmus maximus]|uniref:ciliary rootlet coiled-coil protein 2 isoform X3 n=1 Tax=Scophthalmus maximus TaxID=52904 RepID=UPI0015E0604D|nr:ciliary rootlet coiled-coil protein 2 isoform X3 [Scophthalmus maximus]
MSLRAKSHTDLQAAGKSPLDDSLCTSFSMSSSSVNRGGRFGSGVTEEVKVLPRPPRRPVRAVRPVSAINANGSFLQINHLQGELVRKRKECEDLRKENKYLSNEIHMERIVLRTESELTMRNLRSLNQELQAQVKEHTDLQLLLAQTERNYFETQLKLDRASGEKQALLQDNGSLKGDRDDLRHQLRQVTQENVQVKESESSSRRRAMASEEESKKAHQAQREAEAERRLAEKERQERTSECLSWRERHQELADRFRAQEELTALRQNKACQANIKSYFLCMTESDQRVRILKNQDGTPRNFTEGDPVYISTPESGPEEPERSSSRTMLRVSAPHTGRDPGPGHFDELPALGGERPDSAPARRSRKVVEYFWIPTDQE